MVLIASNIIEALRIYWGSMSLTEHFLVTFFLIGGFFFFCYLVHREFMKDDPDYRKEFENRMNDRLNDKSH